MKTLRRMGKVLDKHLEEGDISTAEEKAKKFYATLPQG